MSINTVATALEYASPDKQRKKAELHSTYSTLAWALFILEVAYHGAVVAYAIHRSPSWTWERFSRNVGNPEIFIGIDKTFFAVGTVLAIIALAQPHRKRWAAWMALVFNLLSLGAISRG